jgi:Glycosyl hydrolase family 79 C-terminal beta domain
VSLRDHPWRLAAGGAVLIAVAAVVAVLLSHPSGGTGSARLGPGAGSADAADTSGPGGSTGAAGAAAGGGSRAPTVPPAARHPTLTLSVDTTSAGRRIAPGFLGFSFEFQGVRSYTGSDPHRINPVLIQLIRNLTPGQAPVLRIGGDSTDVSYVPAPGVHPPSFVDDPLGPSWLATTAALAHQLGARMIMGLNLAADQPRLAAAEARAYVRTVGPGSIEAMEIGNEPNVYGKITVYRAPFGVPVAARPANYDYATFRREFRAIAGASGSVALAGPALAIGPTPGPGAWAASIPGFLRQDSRLAIMTVHRYPLRNCYVPPRSPQYPSIAHLLSAYATTGLADSLKRWIAIAHAAHRQLRVDELNSVACRGKAGVSDTFASALWVTDALFSLANAGVDGIDMHTLPKAAYELFAFSRSGGGWQAAVRPVYYGLDLFAQAAPAGARILPLGRHGRAPGVSAWATRAPDGTVRVVVINKDTAHDQTVAIRLPATAAPHATVMRMLAPSVSAGSGVTLGGRSFGAETASGVLGRPATRALAVRGGQVKVAVPRGSAALITF